MARWSLGVLYGTGRLIKVDGSGSLFGGEERNSYGFQDGREVLMWVMISKLIEIVEG